jgi:hypothetical protein
VPYAREDARVKEVAFAARLNLFNFLYFLYRHAHNLLYGANGYSERQWNKGGHFYQD